MKITKIAITGGPCAGKTAALDRIKEKAKEMGCIVLFVPELATVLIKNGVEPGICGTRDDYQKCLFRLQIETEKVYEQAARTMKADKILIVCDRGTLDNKAYMEPAEFARMLEDAGTNEAELRAGYHAVFHLVTAAKGAEAFYTTANNAARSETAEQAAALDDKLIAAWTGHSHFLVIGNAGGFDNKMDRLIAEISSLISNR